MSETEKPLVTFALFAYNQERFIKEAVEGALAQTYSPLEIILSDDCSTDRTFEIIENMASNYQGPHKVILNRNARNLGLGGHINRIMEISEGELIVVAAGDDISLSNRTAVLVDCWLSKNKTPCSLYSKCIVIDSEGVSTGELDRPPKHESFWRGVPSIMSNTMGCSHAWARIVFEKFGPILPDTIYEDRVIPLRSDLLGGIEYVSESLIKYRIHDSNISQSHMRDRDSIIESTVELHDRRMNIFCNYLADFEIAVALNLIPEIEARSICIRLRIQIKKIQDKIDFMRGGSVVKLSLIRSRLLSDPKQALRWMIAFLFPGVYIKSQKKNLGRS